MLLEIAESEEAHVGALSEVTTMKPDIGIPRRWAQGEAALVEPSICRQPEAVNGSALFDKSKTDKRHRQALAEAYRLILAQAKKQPGTE